jgi:enoyl-CoA hydratase/carnithine racemase
MTRDPDGQIKVERRGRLLLMAIDRREKLNGFTPKIFTELAAAYSQLEESPDLWCGVLYAEGDHFSAGLDMPKIAPLRRAGQPLYPPDRVDPFNLREPFRTKPLLVALKGICFTVAIELMLAADIAIAADNCRFSQLEVKRGIMPGCGATFRMADRAGWGNAMKVLLTGEEFTAADALRYNFVQEVVPLGAELNRAVQIAEVIARQAPLAVQATMANGRLAANHGWRAAVDEIASTQRHLYNSEDAAEGVKSFTEKRDAVFVGR